MYKIMIIEAVKKYVTSRPNSKNFIDPIRKCDQLMCELSKVPMPSENVLVDEVEEIKMKFEVDEFLSELPLNEDGENLPNKSKLKVTLARRLSDLEKSGHGSEIEQKMKEEVQKCLIKFHESIDALPIDSFIEKLKLTEPLRKSHPTNVGGNNYVNDNFVTPPLVNSYKTNYQTETNEKLCCTSPLNTDENQWMSLMTSTPQNDLNNVECNTTSKQIPHNCGLCTTSTQDFGDRFEQTRGIYKEPNAIRPRSANFGINNNDNRCLSNSTYQKDVEEQTYCRDKIPNQTDNSDITTETFEAAIRVTSTPVSHNSVGASNFDRYHNASVTFRRPNFIITQKQNQFSNSQKSASSCSKQCSQIHKSRTSVDNESDQELDVVSRVSGTRSQRALKQRDKEDQDLVRYQISSNRIPHSNCQSRNQSTNGPCNIIRDNDGSNQRKSSGACKPCRKSNLGMIGRKNTSESRVKKLDKEKPISSCTHSVSSDDEESCRCSKKLPHAKSCNTHAKKNCKICTTFSVPTCRYPGFYYC
ncbi:unnamed protein product [Leptosia nina]|uniref:Uncharacterized protein n=1 Tax=Leptosia nina TaxID=320188 RepID=A0AAV1JHQ6_9NEOP